MSRNPMMIVESPLSGRIYATQAYKFINKEKGQILVTGAKHDVTEYVEAIIKKRLEIKQ